MKTLRILTILLEDPNAAMKVILKAMSSYKTGCPKTAGIDNFCRLKKIQFSADLKNPLMCLLASV